MPTGLMTFESMTTGSAPAAELVAASTGPQVVATGNPFHGTKHLRTVNPDTTVSSVRIDIAGATKLETVFYFSLSAPPAAEAGITLVTGTSDSPINAAQLTVMPTTGYLRLRTKGTARWTSTFSVADGKYYRIGLYVDPGTTASNGAVRVAVFDGDNLTALGDSTLISGIDVAGTVGALQNLRINKVDTSSVPGTIDIDSTSIATSGDAGQTFAPYTPAPIATIGPLSVLSNDGNWGKTGTTATHAYALADSSDSTYITNADAANNEAILLRLPPLAAGSSIVGTFRIGLDTGSASTAWKLEILQGATVVATRTGTASSETAADVAVTLTSGEIAAITDRANLRARITAKAV